MTTREFTMEVLNISNHVNGPISRAPYIRVINGDARVVCDNLGEFHGAPADVIRDMVALAKTKTAGLKL